MSTDEGRKAVRPAITEHKRPWTENVTISRERFNQWSVRQQQGFTIATFDSEADARLFAAAPALYEALEERVQTLHYINALRVVETHILQGTLDAARAALCAANPRSV